MSPPLRVLVCIPHFFRRTDTAAQADGPANNGSATDTLAERAQVFRYCLAHLASQLRDTRFLIGSSGEAKDPVTGGELAMDLVTQAPVKVTGDVIIVSVVDNNLLDQIPLAFARGAVSDSPPRLLGYRCRRLLLKHIEDYDLFCFLEDDTAILDPRFFLKVKAFYARFGEDKLVLPNRYELVGRGDQSYRTYLDGPPMAVFRLPTSEDGPPELIVEDFAGSVQFDRTETLMSGCYVITRGQLRRWSAQSDFAAPVPELLARGFDTLEMAQVPLMGTLPIYRPGPANLDFLDVHHVPNRLSNARTPHARMVEMIRAKARGAPA